MSTNDYRSWIVFKIIRISSNYLFKLFELVESNLYRKVTLDRLSIYNRKLSIRYNWEEFSQSKKKWVDECVCVCVWACVSPFEKGCPWFFLVFPSFVLLKRLTKVLGPINSEYIEMGEEGEEGVITCPSSFCFFLSPIRQEN